jgi:opacity protein-like surface antigen
MRKLGLLFLIFAWVIAVQAQGKNDVYVGAGLSLPLNPQSFSDQWNMGYNGGIGYGFGLTHAFSVIGSLEYNYFTIDKKKNADITGGSVSIVTISGNVKCKPVSGSNPISPYLLGGLGFFYLSTSNEAVGKTLIKSGDSESAILILLGAGFDFHINNTDNVFIEAKYGVGFAKKENTTYLPVRIGLRESF